MNTLKQYAKALLVLAGATPPAAVFTWLDSVGIHAVPSWLALVVTAVCALGAVLFGPKNAAKPAGLAAGDEPVPDWLK